MVKALYYLIKRVMNCYRFSIMRYFKVIFRKNLVQGRIGSYFYASIL